MIEGLDIVYYGPEPWEGMWRNRHQLLSRLARANRVVYIEPRPYLRQVLRGWPGRRDPATQAGLARLGDGLWLYRTPGVGAIGGGPLWRPVARSLRVRHLRKALRSLGIERPLVWLSHPSQADAASDLPARLRIYHVVDDYLAYGAPGREPLSWLKDWEDRILAWADLVVAVTPELMETRGSRATKAVLIPNAADVDAFSAALAQPAALPAGASPPVIGYEGLISARLDLDMVERCASRRPEWSWVFVGKIVNQDCEQALERLAGLPNVHFLGVRPVSEIPSIVASWDVGIIPYRVNAETRSASPLKLYEYLAAGLPVVSSDVPAARQFVGLVSIVNGVDEMEQAIAETLHADALSNRLARWGVVRAHSWDARIQTLSKVLAETLATRDGSVHLGKSDTADQ